MAMSRPHNRKKSAVSQAARRTHPHARLVSGLILATLIHITLFRLPWQYAKILLDLFAQPPPQETVIELTLEAAPPIDEAESAESTEIQQLQEFHRSVLARATVLEQTLTEALDQQASAEVARQQRFTAMEAAQSDLREQVANLTAKKTELSAQLVAERERIAALERQIQAQIRAKEAELSGVKGAYDRLVAALKGEILQKEVALHQAKEKLVVTILDRVLFPSGQATLTSEGQRIMKKVGSILANVSDRRILIEGHTDNVPIGVVLSAQFPTNWELSTARATEVVKYLIAEAHLPPHLLSAVGRADTAPIASNSSEEGRQQNRRIEIILLPPEDMLHKVASS